LGIRDREQLRALEGDLTRSRAARLASNPLPGRYDLERLQRFHRELFDGVYDWAGKLRTVPIAKRDLFCLPQHIPSSARDIFDALARERHLSGMSYEDFIDRSPTTYPTSTRCIPSATATAARSARSSPSSRTTRATACSGNTSTTSKTTTPRSPRCAATSSHCATCSPKSSASRPHQVSDHRQIQPENAGSRSRPAPTPAHATCDLSRHHG
jgi:hypothetical protein